MFYISILHLLISINFLNMSSFNNSSLNRNHPSYDSTAVNHNFHLKPKKSVRRPKGSKKKPKILSPAGHGTQKVIALQPISDNFPARHGIQEVIAPQPISDNFPASHGIKQVIAQQHISDNFPASQGIKEVIAPQHKG